MPTIEELTKFPATVESIAADLVNLGVQSGMVLVVHSSLKSMGYVNGGPVAVIYALEQALGSAGTLVMPTHTADLSDPKNWSNPPVPESWWETIRATMPAYDAALTPSFRMGVIPETFRKQTGVLRSDHPDTSFAAWGKHARQVVDDHALVPLFGDRSPLGRTYDLDGYILLLGVGHGNNTALHLAEGRARIAHRQMHTGSPMMVNGVRQWVPWEDIDWDDSDFVQLGADFARESGLQREGKIALAASILVPQRPLVDYAVTWLEHHRN